MTQDDILRMASEAGNSVAPQGDTRGPLYVYLHEVFVFVDLIKQHLISEGYRKCAEGQRTTQYCSQLEAAVAAEREACAQVCEQMSSKFATSRLELLQCLGESLQDAADNIRARGEK